MSPECIYCQTYSNTRSFIGPSIIASESGEHVACVLYLLHDTNNWQYHCTAHHSQHTVNFPIFNKPVSNLHHPYLASWHVILVAKPLAAKETTTADRSNQGSIVTQLSGGGIIQDLPVVMTQLHTARKNRSDQLSVSVGAS
jgi:hypothetical protein